MARNTLAGKRTGKSKSAKHYAKNKKSRDKKKKYDTEYHKTKERKKYRASLNKLNKKKRTYGNKDGMDLSHTKKGKVVKEKKSKNRARNRGKK
jgi:hypothetical protein|tara:strand:- start:553 stop:831 length:279 start_codon:yes stop_codon:yes gene_type:complete